MHQISTENSTTKDLQIRISVESLNDTRWSIPDILEKVKKLCKEDFITNDYIYDLTNSLCVLYKDGLKFKFTHRSFQEYFAAVFLRELTDEELCNISIKVIKNDVTRAIHDSVFTMLYDMAEIRFEKNILLPLLYEFEKDNNYPRKKYDYYFKNQSFTIKFNDDIFPDEDMPELKLWLVRSFSANSILTFLSNFQKFNPSRSSSSLKLKQKAADELLAYLIASRNYVLDQKIDNITILEDKKMYNIFKKTWIGESISNIAKMKEILEKKQEAIGVDLANLM